MVRSTTWRLSALISPKSELHHHVVCAAVPGYGHEYPNLFILKISNLSSQLYSAYLCNQKLRVQSYSNYWRFSSTMNKLWPIFTKRLSSNRILLEWFKSWQPWQCWGSCSKIALQLITDQNEKNSQNSNSASAVHCFSIFINSWTI